MTLTHVGPDGRPRMVDVADKPESHRTAVAEAKVRMSTEAFATVRDGLAGKGDVLRIAEVAGTMAAKRTGDLIPLCHPIGLDQVTVHATLEEELPGVSIRAATKCVARTGVEMEALTAASIAALTIYDMTKAIDRGAEIVAIRLVSKTGGVRGDWHRSTADQ